MTSPVAEPAASSRVDTRCAVGVLGASVGGRRALTAFEATVEVNATGQVLVTNRRQDVELRIARAHDRREAIVFASLGGAAFDALVGCNASGVFVAAEKRATALSKDAYALTARIH